MALIRQRGMSLTTNFFPPVNSSLGNKLPILNRGLLSWIPQVWKVTDDQVLEAAGLDAYVVRAFYPWRLIL